MNKVCPLLCEKNIKDIPLVFRNIDISQKEFEELKKCGGIIVNDCTNIPEIEPLYGSCIEEKCGWWNEENNCCAVLGISKSFNKKME